LNHSKCCDSNCIPTGAGKPYATVTVVGTVLVVKAPLVPRRAISQSAGKCQGAGHPGLPRPTYILRCAGRQFTSLRRRSDTAPPPQKTNNTLFVPLKDAFPCQASPFRGISYNDGWQCVSGGVSRMSEPHHPVRTWLKRVVY